MCAKKIAVLTSGGDAPGMNAAVRAVVRTAISFGMEVYGVRHGYNGLLTGEVQKMELRSVSNIIQHGGTALFTARSPEFNTPEGVQKAAAKCRELGIDGVVIDPWTSSATLDCSLLNGLLHASHDTDEPGEAELRAGNHAMAEERWDDAMHYYQLSAEEGCAEGLAMMGEMLYEGRGCRKSPAQARKFWKKAADAGDVAAWVALGDDAMVQGKGAGAALRAYRKAQKLCASTPDIAYMPQVCLRVAQYETQYISRKKALAQLAEAKQGFLVRKKEGDETAQSWLDETEAVIRQLLERE